MHTFTLPWGETSARPKLVTVLTGTVMSRGEKVTGGGSVYNGQGGISVSSIPDIWLRDDQGQEHHFESHMMGHCREGHCVAIFRERHGTQRLIAMANLSTDQWYGRPDLMDDSTLGSIFWGGVMLAVVLAIPALLLWVYILISVGVSLSRGNAPDWFWSGWLTFVGGGALLLSWKVQTGRDRTRHAVRAEVSAIFNKLRAETGRS